MGKKQQKHTLDAIAQQLFNACLAALSQLTEDRPEYLEGDIRQLRAVIEKAKKGGLSVGKVELSGPEFRVWYIKNVPSEPRFTKVATPDEGAKLIKKLIEKDLRDWGVISNAIGFEVFEDGEWSEWCDNEGRDIDTYAKEVMEI